MWTLDTSQQLKKESMCKIMFETSTKRICLKIGITGGLLVSQSAVKCQFLAFKFFSANNAKYLQQITNILLLEAGSILDIQIQNIE